MTEQKGEREQERLLAAFYRGETTMAEERRLSMLLRGSANAERADRQLAAYSAGIVAECYAAEGMRRMAEAIDGWRDEVPAETPAPTRHWRRLAAAAAAMVIVAGTAFYAWRHLPAGRSAGGDVSIDALMASNGASVSMTLADTAVVGGDVNIVMASMSAGKTLPARADRAAAQATATRGEVMEAARQVESALEQVDAVMHESSRHIDDALDELYKTQGALDVRQI